MKFWGEVLIEFFEVDGTSSDKMLEEHRKEVRDHIDMLQEAEEEINRERKARGMAPLPSQEEEEKKYKDEEEENSQLFTKNK